jgi:hypothetical protein
MAKAEARKKVKRTVTDGIDQVVWLSLGSRAGGEAANSASF